MIYTCTYPSPLGNILLAADEVGLTGLWFEGQKYFAKTLPKETISQETPVLIQAKKWLDVYFSGKEPDFTPALHPAGSPFRQAVWQILLQIPYGQTMTYGEIAKKMAQMQDAPHMSAHEISSLGMLCVSFSRNKRDFNICNRRACQHTEMCFFTEVSKNQSLPVAVEQILFASGIDCNSAATLCRFQKEMNLCIVS